MLTYATLSQLPASPTLAMVNKCLNKLFKKKKEKDDGIFVSFKMKRIGP
jgi:hypothetical protein